MQNILKIGALAALTLGVAQPALADTAETKGGITVKTDDGRFEGKLGGRIHYDVNIVDGDDAGSSADAVSDSFFRRARLTLTGKAYGWEYKFEQDFGGSTATSSVSERDLYIATKLPGGKLLLGQFKPFRGMEEMTSSNEITFMERPYVQANFFSTQFAMGAGYKGGVGDFTYALGLQNRKVDGPAGTNEDIVSSARFTFAPVNADGTVVHLGLSGSMDNLNRVAGVQNDDDVTVQYAGRSIGGIDLSSADFAEGTFIGTELGAAFGPFYVQAEYAMGDLEQASGISEDVAAYYVQASFHVTGETKPYKGGVFKSVKPKSESGAVELKARYELAENKDVTDAEVSAMTLGVNWYVNPNVRFMLDYIMAEAKAGLGVDEPKVISARAQFSF